MKKLFYILLIVLINSYVVKAQQTDSTLINELKKIYINLEYNTIAYDDLKKKWFINDPDFVRDVYSRFIINNELRLNGKPASSDIIKEKSKGIFDGEIVIDVRKRFYDDELEYFAFIPSYELLNDKPTPLFDAVEDPFALKEIIGENLYQRIQKQQYFFADVTKEVFDVKPGYYFNLNLNLLNPEIMFWSTTSNQRNKYLVSLIGKWGNNRIFLPGWFAPDYTLGVQLTYYKVLSADPADYTYKVAVGTTQEAGKPFVGDLPKGNIYKSGQTIYFKINGNLSEYLFPSFPKLYMNFEGQLTYGDYKNKQFGFSNTTRFYSIRDYFILNFTKRDLANIFDLGMLETGLGIATHSLYYYEVDPKAYKLKDLDNKDFFNKFTHFIQADIGLTKRGGLLQHESKLVFSYGSEGFGYFGFDITFMLDDTFGLTASYYSALSLNKNKYPYRADKYLVFSPIIKINY